MIYQKTALHMEIHVFVMVIVLMLMNIKNGGDVFTIGVIVDY